VGRLSDRLHASVLVLTGLALYAAIFIGYAGLNEVTTASMMVTFLIFRFVAEAFIVSPNNLSALQALPEEHVLMASGLLGLLRSVANTLGPALAVVIWDRQYGYYLQRYADNTAFDISEFAATLDSLQAALQHAGEIVSQIPAQALALLHDRLLAEASTAAWKSYFLFNVMLAMLSLLPALPIWQRLRPASLATPAPEVTSGVPTTSRPS
jgi:MFS family permease